jgi:hypothetical protein
MNMFPRLFCLAGLGLLLITPALADDMEKCEGKLKCRGSTSVSNGIKQMTGSQSPANESRRTVSTHGTPASRR